MTLEKTPRRWSRRTKVWDIPNWINLKWISRHKTLLNIGVNNFSDSNQEAFGRPYWHFIGPYPKEWMDSSQTCFCFSSIRILPPKALWFACPPIVSLQTFVHWRQEVRDLHVRSAEIFAGWGKRWGSSDVEWAENSASRESHFTLGNVTQRSSEDFEVGEIIFIHQDRWVKKNMLNMESCSARCLSRTVLFFYYNHCIMHGHFSRTCPRQWFTTKHTQQLLESVLDFPGNWQPPFSPRKVRVLEVETFPNINAAPKEKS